MRFGTLVCILAVAFPSIGFADSPDNGFLIGPITYTQDVEGVSVQLTSRAHFKIETAQNKLFLRARVIGDLGDLQHKIDQIVDKFQLPTDNCRSYSANNPVVSITRKELAYQNGSTEFSVSGSVADWDCRQNPVPNSKVEWQMKRIGPIKTKVPVVHTWPGSPIKNKLVTQPFDARLPITLKKESPFSVALQLGNPDINLKGQYAFITKGVLNLAGININNKAKDALQKAIDPEKLKAVIPEEFQRFNPEIEDAKFIDDGGQLAVEMTLSALIPASEVTDMIKGLINKKETESH